MIKWTLIILASLVGIAMVTALVGMFVPKTHRASRAVVISAPRDKVFAIIADVANASSWRTDLKSVTVLEGAGSGMRFREVGGNGPITYRVDECDPPSRFVTRIDDPSLPFGGTWTFELRDVSGGTELTITEDAAVYNPIFRFFSLFMSQTATIDKYQSALVARVAR